MAHQLRVSSNENTLASDIDLETPEIKDARIDLAACFRMAAQLGLNEGIDNHFSALVPGHDNLFFVNPYGLSFAEVTASSLLICDFKGNVICGNGYPEATAFYIHAKIHELLPRASVAFHTHMPYATALCMVEGDPLAWAGQSALKFYGRVAIDENYNGLALDSGEGARIAAVAGNADIVFMRNHGVLVLAPTLGQAFDDLYYLERAAQAQVIALSTGRRLLPVSPALAEATGEQFRSGDAESGRLHLASIRRRLKLLEPDFMN